MSVLSASNLRLSFGAFDLFKGLSVEVANDSKIGLIGQNGIGKTSLLQILAGINAPTEGIVHIARGKRLGYLRQEAVEAFADRSSTVYEEVIEVFIDLQQQQAALNELENKMSHGDFSEEMLNAYGELQDSYEKAGGYDYELRIQQTLEGLDLGKKYWNKPLNHLSGGQKTRVLLARLLLEKPDLLMLDEPTNHLDMDAVEWLERTLKNWDGALLIASHDRYFLDNTVNTIWDMNRMGIDVYHGNYSSYLLQRQERWEYYDRVFEEEKNRMLKQVDFILRNWVRASTHARAFGLLKRLSRDISIVENYGIMALRNGKKWSQMDLSADRPLDVLEATRKVNAITPEFDRPARIRPRLVANQPSGTIIIQSERVVIGYPGNTLFTARNLELKRGECAAMIGPNGSGKTTFLKVLLKQLDPLSGSIRLGASLRPGYFAQAQDNLNGENSILDELMAAKSMPAQEARSYLAKYLFKGEDVFKPVRALSGGERARLALAIMSLKGANFLLLDEPTNHLDIPAREALQEVLGEFEGTILLVSHDRYLVDKLATQIWSLQESQLICFKGTYREYILRGLDSSLKLNQREKPPVRQAALPEKPLFALNGRESRQRDQKLTMLEERIQEQEVMIRNLSIQLQKLNGPHAPVRIQELSSKIAQAQAVLDSLLTEWEKVA